LIANEDQKMLLKMNYNEMEKSVDGKIGGSWGNVFGIKFRGSCFGKQKNSKCKILCC
jgi:hypothetical protein